jgi:subtilase family serine protease
MPWAVLLLLCAVAFAAPDRLSQAIDDSHRVTLDRSVSLRAQPAYDQGRVDPAFPIDFATLLFRPSAQQQADLDRLLEALQDESSADYHRWLTPAQFGDRFGLSAGDLSKVSAWLEAYGLKINDVAQGRHWITFSGAAARVEAAFRTEIHRYAIDGETLFANSTPLSIPAALDGIVGAVGGLNNFGMRHTPRPAYTGSGGVHYLAPDDLATIYDITPLYQVGYDGAGQKIMIIGGSDIEMSDLQGFATTVGLPFQPASNGAGRSRPGLQRRSGRGRRRS